MDKVPDDGSPPGWRFLPHPQPHDVLAGVRIELREGAVGVRLEKGGQFGIQGFKVLMRPVEFDGDAR